MTPIVEKDGSVYYLIEWVGDDFDYHAEFVIHEVTAWEFDRSVAETTECLTGTAKWDGNLHLHTADKDGYIPIFGKRAMDNYISLLAAIWEHVAAKITKWDNDLAQN